MTTRAVIALPISQFRTHTKWCLTQVCDNIEHVILTKHGRAQACMIPMRDARVLWQLQGRPMQEMEDRLLRNHALWRSARTFHEAWESGEIDEARWTYWAGFEKV